MFQSDLSRRQFLAKSSLIAVAPTVPAFLRHSVLAADAQKTGRILVVFQMSGGNDGINTVVSHADEAYAKLRDKLRLADDTLIKMNDELALHPSLRPAADLMEDGRLSIVQGVGYPNPNRSHDVSMAIWQTARFDPREHKSFGWIGQAMDGRQMASSGAPHSVLLGNEYPPVALRGRRSTSVSLAHLDDLKLQSKLATPAQFANANSVQDLTAFARRAALDAYSTADLIDEVTASSAGEEAAYPTTTIGKRLQAIAQLIKADFGTPVYYAIQGGYDTHAAQLPTHARLLRDLSGALQSFLNDLRSAKLDDRVVVLAFSEFGRRAKENASFGTDHGTAGPVFVAGAPVASGFVGETPRLDDLENGDVKMTTDFRNVYATLLDDWLGLSSEKALGGSFDSLPLLRGI